MYAVGLGAGLACGMGSGIACGVSAGKTRAREEVADALRDLVARGEIVFTDGEGREVPVDELLPRLFPPPSPAARRTLIVLTVLGTLLLVAGVIVFFLVRGSR